MEEALNLKYGVAGICVMLAFHLLVRVAEFLWHQKEKKDRLSDAAVKNLTLAVEKNTSAITHLDVQFAKFKLDLRRMFTALKIVSGDKWPEIRKHIMEEDFPP